MSNVPDSASSRALYSQIRRGNLAEENQRLKSGEALRGFRDPTIAVAVADPSRGLLPGTLIQAACDGAWIEVLLPADRAEPVSIWAKREARGWAEGVEVSAVNAFTPLNPKQALALTTSVSNYRARHVTPTHARLAAEGFPVPAVDTPVDEQRVVMEFLESRLFRERYAEHGPHAHAMGLRYFATCQAEIDGWEKAFGDLIARIQPLVTMATTKPAR